MKKTKHFLWIGFPLVLALASPLPCFAQGKSDAKLASLGADKTTPQKAKDPNPSWSDAELDQLLAPVALYPDSLLSQVLMASTFPLEIVIAERWVGNNSQLHEHALDNALQKLNWDVSVKSLAFFPSVLTMMSEQLEWTSKLGDAFIRQDKDVMESIQRLRIQAQKAGQLTTTPEHTVVVEREIIRIEPSNPNIIYVPVYSPTVVYGHWWHPMYPPYVFYPWGYAAFGPRVIFTSGFICGAWVFGGFAWNSGYVYFNHHSRFLRHHRHHRHHHDRNHRSSHGNRRNRSKGPTNISHTKWQRNADRGTKSKARPATVSKLSRPINNPGMIKRTKRAPIGSVPTTLVLPTIPKIRRAQVVVLPNSTHSSPSKTFRPNPSSPPKFHRTTPRPSSKVYRPNPSLSHPSKVRRTTPTPRPSSRITSSTQRPNRYTRPKTETVKIRRPSKKTKRIKPITQRRIVQPPKSIRKFHHKKPFVPQVRKTPAKPKKAFRIPTDKTKKKKKKK